MAKKTKPDVSVIVSCYKGGTSLPKCLNALLEQTLENIEVICINDGSPDNTEDILQDFAGRDDRIVAINNKNNLGIAKSRNIGIELAKADYIMFCDADDYYEPSMCEDLLKSIKESDADLAISEIHVIYEAHSDLKYSDDNYYSLKFSGLEEITDDIILNTDLSPTNKIFRKSIIEKYQIRYPEGLYYEDAYFCPAYLCSSKNIFYLNERLYNYIRHENSTMSNTFSSKVDKDLAINHLYIAFRLFDFLTLNNLIDKYNDLFWQLFYSFELFALNNSKTRKRVDEVKTKALNFIAQNKEYFEKTLLFVQEEIQSINARGLRINKAKAKKALIRLMPAYRLQVSNIQRLRSLKNRATQLNERLK